MGRLIHGFGFLSKAEFISLLISIVLIVLTLIVSDTIYNSNLEYKDKISILIFLITCLGGLLAANFFIMNYVIAKESFVHTLEPALLIQVVSEINPGSGPTGVTIIRYHNPTNNVFLDLNIFCEICFWTPCIDYSSLFSSHMYMGPHDERIRRFNFTEDLRNKGYDIQEMASSGRQVRLLLSFSYTFSGKKRKYKIQEYKWDHEKRMWDII